MTLILKGITKTTTILNLKGLVDVYAFDLRPKSFNFTSFKNIESTCREYSHENYRLLLAGTEDIFTITETLRKITEYCSQVELEFFYNSNIGELERIGVPYVWHYSEEISFEDLKKTKFLSTIVFSHSYLEKLSVTQKLASFLNLFKEDEFSFLKFELSLGWNDALIESMFSYFDFDSISFEINFQVEKSYQNPNNELIKNELENIQKRKAQYDDNTNLK